MPLVFPIRYYYNEAQVSCISSYRRGRGSMRHHSRDLDVDAVGNNAGFLVGMKTNI